MQRTPDKNFMHIVQTMNRVQECSWQPFKLNEVVTLEKCLQELSLQDPRFNLLLRKFSSECSLVEPARKLQHLKRTKQEELQDNESKRGALDAVQQLSFIDRWINFYEAKLGECLESEKEMRLEIIQVEKSIQAVDKIYKLLMHEFSLSLERVYNSFLDSMATLELIPKFIESIGRSRLVRQMDTLSVNYRKRILRLSINSSACIDSDARFSFMELATRHLTRHIRLSSYLLRDLALIVKLYSTELAVEQDHLKALEGHIDYLRRPVCESPPYIIIKSVAGVADDNEEDAHDVAYAQQAIDDLQPRDVAELKLSQFLDLIGTHT